MQPRKTILVGVTMLTPALVTGQAAAKVISPAEQLGPAGVAAMLAPQERLKTALLAIDPAAKLGIASERIGGMQYAQIPPTTLVGVTKNLDRSNNAQGGAHNTQGGAQGDGKPPVAGNASGAQATAQGGVNNTGRCAAGGAQGGPAGVANGPQHVTIACATANGVGARHPDTMTPSAYCNGGH